jgi:hypothetical protein
VCPQKSTALMCLDGSFFHGLDHNAMPKAASRRANHACAGRAGASGRFTLTLLDFA